MYHQKPKYNIYAGLLPAADTNVISENRIQKRDEFKTAEKMEPNFNNHRPDVDELLMKTGQVEVGKEAPSIVEKKKKVAKRKGSIDGQSIKEITHTIIKEKPSLPKTIKAFAKMAEISQTQRDNELFEFEIE
jgi:hypothetical protein